MSSVLCRVLWTSRRTSRAPPDSLLHFTSYHTRQFIIFTITTVIFTHHSFNLSFRDQALTLWQSFPTQTFSSRTGLTPRIIWPFSVFILMNGWLWLHDVAFSRFRTDWEISAYRIVVAQLLYTSFTSVCDLIWYDVLRFSVHSEAERSQISLNMDVVNSHCVWPFYTLFFPSVMLI